MGSDIMQEEIMNIIKDGVITIPKILLYNYKKLNMNEIDLILLIYLIPKNNQEFNPAVISKDLDIPINDVLLNIEHLTEVNNRKRLVRLLNKLENNEEITNNKDKLLYNIKVIGLTTDRKTLYERINKRVDIMLENGLLNEINSLKEDYKTSRILNSGIGYKEFYDYLYNNKNLEDVIDDIKKNSRHFAKRQYTFFNHQFNTNWFEVDLNNFSNTINEVINFLKKF